MFKSKTILTVLLIIMTAVVTNAQNMITVQGTILAKSDGEALIGAAVQLKSDLNGKRLRDYVLKEIPEGISFASYQSNHDAYEI